MRFGGTIVADGAVDWEAEDTAYRDAGLYHHALTKVGKAQGFNLQMSIAAL